MKPSKQVEIGEAIVNYLRPEIYTERDLKMSEDAIQSAAMIHAKNANLSQRMRIFAIPNGGTRNKIEAAKLKATGTTSGVWDVCFLRRSGRAVWIEFKSAKKGLTDDQKEFARQNPNCDFWVVDTVDLAIALFDYFFKNG